MAPGICCTITFRSPLFNGQNTPSQCGSQVQCVSQSPRPQGPTAGFLKIFQVTLVCGAWLFRTLFSHWVCLRAAASVVSDSLRSHGL